MSKLAQISLQDEPLRVGCTLCSYKLQHKDEETLLDQIGRPCPGCTDVASFATFARKMESNETHNPRE